MQNNVFVLYLPKRIKLQPGEFINADMKLSVRLPEQIIAECLLLPTLCKNGLGMESFQYISATTTFSMLANLLTYRRKYILNWLIEV